MAIHSAIAPTLAAIVATSKRPSGAGKRPGLARASQLWVKLGTMRPPTSVIRMTMAPIPARSE